MQAQVFRPSFLPPTFNSITALSSSSNISFPMSVVFTISVPHSINNYQHFRAQFNRVLFPDVCRSKKLEDEALAGLPKEFHDEEWQARQREKTKELERLRQEEDEEEERIIDEYREIGMLLKGYPQEDVFKAKKLVSGFIKSAEEIKEKIEEAAEKGRKRCNKKSRFVIQAGRGRNLEKAS
ncbi:hypothetical protein L1987_03760 [Smallanthus sonchifolius]|uniref:Uncharacterized protein n=1 Tax=Smallanthus sonchifolius TaxID=185202 RepID=A0ACB9KBL8_9ASTR|nr:hypothetical protein L1987_03760 [Smallanthus sonchifolius]